MTASLAVVRAISRSDDHRTVTVSLGGSLTYVTADELFTSLTLYLDTHPPAGTVQLDCANVDFCDSWGRSVLLRTHRATIAAGAVLRLVNLPTQLRRIFQVTGTVDLLNVADSIDITSNATSD